MKQNNSTELLGYSFSNIYNKNDPRPPRPQIHNEPQFRFCPRLLTRAQLQVNTSSLVAQEHVAKMTLNFGKELRWFGGVVSAAPI